MDDPSRNRSSQAGVNEAEADPHPAGRLALGMRRSSAILDNIAVYWSTYLVVAVAVLLVGLLLVVPITRRMKRASEIWRWPTAEASILNSRLTEIPMGTRMNFRRS
jgi:hypothetical protein